MTDSFKALRTRVMTLNTCLWEKRLDGPSIDRWLENFTGDVVDVEVEREHALFWLSQFMYFGSREIRELLKSLYRDLYLYPVIQEIEDAGRTQATGKTLEDLLSEEVQNTRFFGIGNPSESGVHLLYFFRQENQLRKENFMEAVTLFQKSEHMKWGGCLGRRRAVLNDPTIKRYVFLDDICGSGETAIKYSNRVITELLRADPNAKISYCCLFGTKAGLEKVRRESAFSQHVHAVHELDRTYRCLDQDSRYFNVDEYPSIKKELACRLARTYGEKVNVATATGFGDSQLLLGFHHNTPDNTLGIIWQDSAAHKGSAPWTPIFKRYAKYPGGF